MQQHEWYAEQRQPLRALLVVLYKVIQRIVRVIIPLLLLWLFKKNNSSGRQELIVIAIAAIIVVSACLEYFFFRFGILEDQLQVRKGFFTKKNISLPLAKIQAVHISQDWLHRLLQLSEVSFDTGGSGNAEAKITIETKKAEALRQFILGTQVAATEDTGENKGFNAPFFYLNTADLFRLGLSANHLQTFFIIIAFLFSFLDDIENVTGKKYTGMLETVSRELAGGPLSTILFLAVAATIISVVFSFIRIVLRYANFRISKNDSGFHIQSGLISTREKLVPFSKVQHITWRANAIRRLIPFYILQLHSISEEQANKNEDKLDVMIPVTRMGLLPELLKEYTPTHPEAGNAVRIQKQYISRAILLKALLPCFILLPVLYLFIQEYAFLLLLLIPYTAITASVLHKKFLANAGTESLWIQRSVWGKKYTLVNWYKLQSVEITQGLYQQKRGLANLNLYTAGGRIRIPFLALEEACRLRNYALYKIESSEKRWV